MALFGKNKNEDKKDESVVVDNETPIVDNNVEQGPQGEKGELGPDGKDEPVVEPKKIDTVEVVYSTKASLFTKISKLPINKQTKESIKRDINKIVNLLDKRE